MLQELIVRSQKDPRPLSEKDSMLIANNHTTISVYKKLTSIRYQTDRKCYVNYTKCFP